MNRILCLWLPNWPLQRFRRERLELEGRSIVLHHSRRGRLEVAHCCARAFARGVRPGMPLAEVATLARPSAHAPADAPVLDEGPHPEAWDPSADRAQLVELAQWCASRFSPVVGIEEVEHPQALLLDITGLAPLFGGEDQHARRILRAFQERQWSVRIAVADTLGAAWAVAHYGERGRERISHDQYSIPNVQCSGSSPKPPAPSPQPSPQPLSLLPIAALRLPGETLRLLHSLGLERIGQVLSLPRRSLRSRFGELLVRRLDQALGTAPEPIIAVRSTPRLEAEWSPEEPIRRQDWLEPVLQRLLEQVAGALVDRGEGATELVWTFRQVDAPQCAGRPAGGPYRNTLRIGLSHPSDSPRHGWELTRLHLERQQLAPVEHIHLLVARRERLVLQQRELFPQDHQEEAELARLIDRLAARLGEQAVVRAVACREAQPELSCRYEPWTKAHRSPKPALAAKLPWGPMTRPLWLFARPLPLRDVTTAADGMPSRFRLEEREHHAARCCGPERIETGWWRRRGVRRDYYRVETTTGQWFWLFRSLADDAWFCQGEFV